LGNLGWLIGGQGRLIAFDLDLDHELRLQPSPVLTADIARMLDVLLITHEHGDHFNAETAAILSQISDCLFVLPVNCLSKAKRVGIPRERIFIARPGIAFDLLDITIQPIRALHGDKKHAVYRYANLDDCGYIVTVKGKRFLQPGDSVLLQDHLECQDIDVLFVSPTEHNTHIEDSLTLIVTLKPDYIFPQHFGTYHQTKQNAYWTRGYPDELKAALPISMQKRFYKLRQGDVFKITGC
jgi:L-ascorbate metabolism protein UlaG (beta-lactamase superfamily)